MNIDREEIVTLTEQYGGTWALNHSRRLLGLIEVIGEGQSYNPDALWLAAYLHDWGAYAPWAQKDVDHALRSRQVAEEFLAERGCPAELLARILETIELHHSSRSDCSMEAILLRDADGLDFLGVAGTLRIFSKNFREMRKAYQEAQQRRDKVLPTLYLGKAREMAARRVRRMDNLLQEFEEETFGCF